MGDTAGAQASMGPGSGPLVLVVDDNPDTVLICTRALESAGYRVATATSGDEALARLDELKPGLVLLDLAMPGRDGFATARAIRARPASANLPILILTALPRDAHVLAADSGGGALCTKPIEPRRLVAEVRRLCPLK